jgi:hypothetical protein
MPFDFAAQPEGREQPSPSVTKAVMALGDWRPVAEIGQRRGLAAVVQYFLCGLGVRGA